MDMVSRHLNTVPYGIRLKLIWKDLKLVWFGLGAKSIYDSTFLPWATI